MFPNPPMFPKPKDQLDLMQASISFGLSAMEAQAIIAMRLWGMVGLWNTSPSENMRMITEKATAALAVQQGVARAILAGKGPGAAALAAVKPVRQRTRANVKRLTRQGPKTGA